MLWPRRGRLQCAVLGGWVSEVSTECSKEGQGLLARGRNLVKVLECQLRYLGFAQPEDFDEEYMIKVVVEEATMCLRCVYEL